MNFSSKLLENAVHEFAKFPSIGKKTALRIVLNLLKQPIEEVEKLTYSITQLKQKVCFCQTCHNISDQKACEICIDSSRNSTLICVVEDIRDVMAIENTRQFRGLYHVLGGLISPMDGIGPGDLNIETLIARVRFQKPIEVVFAISATMEGDTTIFYLYKKLKDFSLKMTTIARGISFGGELEYVDEITLARSIETRVPYEQSLIQ